MSDTTPEPGAAGPDPSPVIHFARLKIVGTWVIGSLIAMQAISEADHVVLFGPVWGPRARLINVLLLGGFYATERYLTKSGTWYKFDERPLASTAADSEAPSTPPGR